MTVGIYKKRKVDWGAFEIDRFIPHLYVSNDDNGCGATALSLLTGIHPHVIVKDRGRRSRHWSDSFMVKFLCSHGFTVQKITMCDVTNSVDEYFSIQYVGERHVLLMSQLMQKNIASWSVAHNRIWYHNFQTCSFSGLNVVNYPILTCYLLKHPSWMINLNHEETNV
jgi:hypothetical protein